MHLFSIFIISPFWGAASPRLFLRAWLAFLGMVACLIHLKRGNTSWRTFRLQMYNNVTDLLFGAILLFAGFYMLYFLLPLGRSSMEVFTYWLASTVQMAFLLPQVGRRIDRLWQQPLVLEQERATAGQAAVDDYRM